MRVRSVKSVLVAAAMLLAFSVPASAQSGLSVIVGGSLGNLIPKGFDVTAKGRFGIVGGISFERALNEKLNLMIEAMYHQVGSNFEFSDGEIRLRLAYLNIPLLAAYSVSDKLAILGGLDLGMLLSNSEKSVVGGESADIADSERVIKSGVALGVAFGIKWMLQERLFLQVLYKWGLTDVSNQDVIQNADISMKPRSLLFKIGFALGGR